MSLDKASKMQMFEYQNLDWISTDVDPIVVLNKWYTPLLPTKNVKARYLVVEQTNNGAANETIEIELTINGTIYLLSILVGSGSENYYSLDINGVIVSTVSNQMLSLDADQSAPLETRSLGIRVRQTSVVDVVSAIIEVNMVYGILEVS